MGLREIRPLIIIAPFSDDNLSAKKVFSAQLKLPFSEVA
jgi:hypothetical protein